jgi:hypothetical protein
MACLAMYNSSEHKGHHYASPRISFSSDFVDLQQSIKQERSSRDAPPAGSSDFEFSVSNYSMMSADELFFKGRFLPFKDNYNNNQMQRTTTTTLRDELLVDDDDDESSVLKPPKGSTRWKGLLGLNKRTHIGSKKIDKGEGSAESKRSSLVIHEEPHASQSNSQVS